MSMTLDDHLDAAIILHFGMYQRLDDARPDRYRTTDMAWMEPVVEWLAGMQQALEALGFDMQLLDRLVADLDELDSLDDGVPR